MFAVNVVVAESSSFSDQVNFKTQHSDQLSIKCLQARVQQMHCTNHRINTWSRKCFRHFMFSIEYIQLSISFSFYCFSRSRTLLFCFSSNFSDFNETSTESKKFSRRISTRLREAFRIDHALFCSVFSHWVFQILTKHRQRTKNHLSTDQACC